MSKEPDAEDVGYTINMLGLGLIVIGLIAGASLTLIQAILWLYDGYWTPLSVIDLWSRQPGAPLWVYYPQEWKGLHKVLQWIGPGTVLVVIGYITGRIGVYLSDQSDQKSAEERRFTYSFRK